MEICQKVDKKCYEVGRICALVGSKCPWVSETIVEWDCGGASDTGRLLVPGGLGVPPGFKETMP